MHDTSGEEHFQDKNDKETCGASKQFKDHW